VDSMESVPQVFNIRGCEWLKRFNQSLNHIEEYFSVLSLLFASVLIFINVIMRYFFGTSIPWSGELARYLIIWFIFIGSSIAVRERAHAKVDVLIAHVPPYYKKALSILASALGIVFCGFIIVSGIQTIQTVVSFTNITPALGIPMYIPYLALPIGAALMMYRFIQVIFEDIKGDFTQEEEGTQ